MSFVNVVRLAAALVIGSTASHAAVFTFNTDPFAGSMALQMPGRQIVGNELFIPQFDLATDVIAFDRNVFGTGSPVSFANSLAATLPLGGSNVVVIQDVDGDGDPGNGLALNAPMSANLIANRVTQPGAGFFVYFNTGLGLNRLVYSTDLDSPLADLKIVARFTGPTGQNAIDALPQFSAANFTTVPEPATIGLLLAGLAGVAFRRRAATARSIGR